MSEIKDSEVLDSTEADKMNLVKNPVLRSRIQKLNLTLTLSDLGFKITEWRGHNKSGTYWDSLNNYYSSEERTHRVLREAFDFLSDENYHKIVAVLQGGEALAEPVVLGSSHSFQCHYCGESLKLATDGKTLLIVGDPCPFPGGIDHHDFELNVPSGVLVVANDLRHWYPIPCDRDINDLQGKIQMTEDYAKAGLAMGFVGSSSPDLMRVKKAKDKFVIASYLSKIWDEEGGKEVKNPVPNPWGKTLAHICTDLWWYSVADGDDFTQRLAYYSPDTSLEDWASEYGQSLVKVKPGVYRFRWYPDADEDSPLYTSIDWVRPPDPVVDLLSQSKAEKLTALECCIQEALDSPTLYFPQRVGSDYDDRLTWEELAQDSKLHAIARAADHLMCVIGGGVDWHENGHARMRISEQARLYAGEISVEGIVPPFAGENHWYPFSAGYGGLCLGAGVSGSRNTEVVRLNDSFAMLALNIVQNFLQYPPKPQLNREAYPPRFGVKEVRDRMLLALECYRGIRKNYGVEPFDFDFDKCALYEQAESHIAQRDLGPDHPPVEEWGPVPPIIAMGEHKFVEFTFDPAKNGGGPCWHPRNPGAGGCWAKAEDAQRYAILHSKQGRDEFTQNAGNSVPLQFVARIVGVGSTHMGPNLMIEFDYGHEGMWGPKAHRWALEKGVYSSLRAFDDPQEYERILPEMVKVYEDMEALIRSKLGESL